jgi:sugar O-acyltransferase (sialic acid O-acetyltransferase NeuD family)
MSKVDSAGLQLLGVLDSIGPRKDDLKRVQANLQFYSDISEIEDDPEVRIAIAVGDPDARFRLSREVRAAGRRLATVVHPTAYVAPTATLADGVVLCPFVFVGPFARIGESVILNTYASAGHDAVIGAGSTLSPYSCLNGSSEAGRACFLGSGAILSPKSRIGDGSKISAGSIFNGEAEPGSLVHGNPAKARVMRKVNLPD